MPVNRRQFISLAAGSLASGFAVSSPVLSAALVKPKIKAIAFDGFTVLDPRPIFALAEALFPEQGVALGNSWRIRQFEYSWLRTLSGNYVGFMQVTEEALVFAAKSLKLQLTASQKQQLMDSYYALRAWPDALPILKSLKAMDLHLAFLSNLPVDVLDAAVKNSGFTGLFDAHLSTDKVRAFKPDPRAYQMGIDAFRLQREEIAFAAFGGWDAAGAKWFGYPTVWINRLNVPLEELGVSADKTGNDLRVLQDFVDNY
ncbi:MAG: haloacid dehalogenase type II [Methylobacter sp.]|nr:MAG: haloacid dehalogenase type II [Methylobacter sp.]